MFSLFSKVRTFLQKYLSHIVSLLPRQWAQADKIRSESGWVEQLETGSRGCVPGSQSPPEILIMSPSSPHGGGNIVFKNAIFIFLTICHAPWNQNVMFILLFSPSKMGPFSNLEGFFKIKWYSCVAYNNFWQSLKGSYCKLASYSCYVPHFIKHDAQKLEPEFLWCLNESVL